MIETPVEEMIELDFKTKDEIYILRAKYVIAYPELYEGDYEPSRAVFGKIVTEKP